MILFYPSIVWGHGGHPGWSTTTIVKFQSVYPSKTNQHVKKHDIGGYTVQTLLEFHYDDCGPPWVPGMISNNAWNDTG